MKLATCWLLLGLSVWLLAAPASRLCAAHPFSLTEALAYVQQDRVTVTIDIFVEDLYLFHNLQPNSNNVLTVPDLQRGMDLHKAFLLERFQVLDLQGQQLDGKVIKVEAFNLPEGGVPLGESMNYSVRYTMEYPLDDQPEFLTFMQRMVDESLGIPAEMQLRVRQEGSGTDLPAVLQPGFPERVHLDWDAPTPSPEASQEEWEQWVKKRREETLGITSYGSVYSFIYIERDEVRHEVLIPLITLENSVLIPRDGDAFLDLDEQAAAREQIEAYFTAGNPVTIDGQSVTPTVSRLDFFGLDFKDFAMQADPKQVSLANARVGIILSYSSPQPPREATITWNRFNDFIYTVRSIVYANDVAEQVFFTESTTDAAIYAWKASADWELPSVTPVAEAAVSPPGLSGVWPSVFIIVAAAVMGLRTALGKLPSAFGWITTVSLLVMGVLVWSIPPAGNSTRKLEQQKVAETLVDNLYEAFRFRHESQIYDALAASVDGPLLRNLFLQMRRGLQMEEQGGAVQRIEKVAVLETEPLDSEREQFTCQCLWTVAGFVEHWGHIHKRTNQYLGRLTIGSSDGDWKITGLQLVDEERIKFETGLRGLKSREP